MPRSKLLLVLLLVLLLTVIPAPSASIAALQPVAETPPGLENLPPDLAAGWSSAVEADLARREYQVTWQEQPDVPGLPAAHQAPNRAQNLRAYFAPQGLTLLPRTLNAHSQPASSPVMAQPLATDGNPPPPPTGDTAAPWQLSLSLTAYGYSDSLQPVPEPTLTAAENMVTYDYGQLTEWYRNDDTGLKHGFTLNRPPADAAPSADARLALALALHTDLTPRLSADGQSLTLTDAAGQPRLTYDQLQVTDAAGQPLPAHFEWLNDAEQDVRFIPHPSSFILSIDAASATFPLTVDPLFSTPPTADTSLEINQAGAHFGKGVAGAGDVNGDGYADVIVGAPDYDNGETDEGAAFIYYGSPTGISATPDLTLESNQAGAAMGSMADGIGDVNGDGYADISVGAYLYDHGQTDEGVAFIYYGSATGLNPTPAALLESNQDTAYMSSAREAGDINGDGYADVVVPVQGYDNGQTNEGAAFVYYGSAAGLSATPDIRETNQADISYVSVAGAGDVNGDGYDDVLFSALLYDNGETDEGVTWVYHGSAAGLSATPAVMLEGNQASAWFGTNVAGAGDINGDGYADIVIGAYLYDNGQTNEGAAFVYHGSATGISATPAIMLESNQTEASMGLRVDGAGDVNGDGYADILVSAHGYDNGQTNEGAAFIYLGSAAGVSATPTVTLESNQTEALMGYSLAGAGDVNGDGFADVLVAANLYDNGQTDEGAAWVYHGGVAFGDTPWAEGFTLPGLSSTVYATARDSSGNLYVAGAFTTAGDLVVNRIARWDGSSWSALGSGLNGAVYALAVDGSGTLYAGGIFTAAGGVSANRIARWDGSSWSALGSGLNNTVYDLAVDGSGNLYAGGDFSAAGGVSASYLARWNGSSWSALGSGMNSYVRALAVDGGGNLYAGGYFTTAGGVSANYIARWNGSSWSALGSGMSSTVTALAVDGSGNLYAGGSFTTAGGVSVNYIARWDGSSWSALGSGLNNYVNALAVDGSGNLYAGGLFTTAGGVSANRVARWDGSSWSALGSGMSDWVYALAVDGSGTLYAGGPFTTAGGVSANYIARWNGSSWSVLGSGMSSTVTALAVDGSGHLYAGGSFTTAGAVSANRVARWDGSSWSALGSGMNNTVRALAVDGSGNLYAGGDFGTTGGVSANRVARWNGSSWSALGSGISGGLNNNGIVYALTLDNNDNLYAGGNFGVAGGKASNNIAAWIWPTPEIQISGNGQPIPNGDTSPTLVDHTDFGEVVPGAAITRTFTIANTGLTQLALTGSPRVALSGPAVGEFSVVTAPASIIAAGDSTTFQVRFKPSVVGTRAVTVTLVSNDEDERVYTFALQGRGAPPVCFTEYTGDNTTDFASLDAQAVRDAVAAVGAGSTVKIAGYCAGVQASNGITQTVRISQPLTLTGGYTATNWLTAYPLTQTTTLDALEGGRVIYAGSALTLNNLRLQHGRWTNDSEAGGGIYASQPMTLSHVTVYSNTAQYGGGAFFGSTATLAGTTFTGNTASSYRGGGAYFYSTATLTGSTFSSNTATSSGGGGAYFNSTATLTGSTFSSNTAHHAGGALFGSTATLTGSTFSSNTAQYGGGAWFSGAATLTGTTFTDNTASSYHGGGAYFYSTATLTGSTFISNTTNNNGGGAYFGSTATLTGSTFSSNTAYFGGGADFNSTATLTGTTFTGNTANYYGGGAYFYGATANQLANTLFARNSANSGGAAIYVDNAAPLALVHTTIVSPTAPVGATQAVYVGGGTVYLTNTLIASHTVGIEQTGGTVVEDYTLFSDVATPTVGVVTGGGHSLTGPAAFYDTTAYTLTAGSMALDTGVAAGVSDDYFGHPRPQGGGFDIGYAESSDTAQPDLTVSQRVSPVGPVSAGQTITYTLAFSNAANGVLTGVIITDTLPASLTNASVVSSGLVFTATAAASPYVWTAQDLRPGWLGLITITAQISPNLTTALFTNTVIAAASNDTTPANNSAAIGLEVRTPEITVSGNGQAIAAGDTTPSLADHTDFGSVSLGQAVTRTFTISNSGNLDLTLTGSSLVAVTGPAALDFSLVVSPTTPIAAGDSATFQVRFDPTIVGARVATLTIASNDPNENPYDFTIQGVGLARPNLLSVSPARNTLTAPLDSAIVLTYSAALESASVTSRTVAVYAMMQGVVTAAHTTVDNVVTVTPNRPFFPGELAYASATTSTTDITGTQPLAPTVWQFNAAVSAGYGRFGDVPVAIGGAAVANSYSLAWGDMDHDGDLDIAVGNDGQSTVYPNNGDGSFGAPINLGPSNVRFISLVWGDFDNDGDLDLAAGNNGGANYIYPNNGDGSFGSPLVFDPNIHGTYTVAWGDIDGDGDLDIAAANYWTPNVVFRNNGDGTFNREVFDAANDPTINLVLADFDGDGDLDIAIANNTRQNKLYFNNGQGLFSTVVNFGSGNDPTYRLAVGDVDGDGDLDIAAANENQPIYVYLNDGHGDFSTSVTAGSSTSYRSVVLGDFDQDDDLDLAAAVFGGPNMLFLNNGSGSFGPGIQFGTGADLTFNLAAGDVDNDGDLDLAAANFNQQNSVWLNEPGPNVAIAKTVQPASAAPGQAITYTLTFSNTGGWAAGVIITDRIPVSLTVQSVVSSGVAITDTGATPAYAWQVQDLAPGVGGVITLTGVLSNPLAEGIFTNTAVITAGEDSAPANNTATADVTVLGPEMAVLGNDVTIAAGDTTPNSVDHTDFGNVIVGQALTRTFTISNSGDSDLSISSLSLSGTAAGDFSLSGLTTPATVSAGNTATFDVRFDPTVVGTRVATVTIANNDADENPYDFAIQGTGTIPTVQFSQAAYQVNETGTAIGPTVTLTRTGQLDGESQVQVAFTDDTATGGGVDYTSTPITITFPAGDNGSQTITVPINQDSIAEPTESLTMTIVSARNAQIGDRGTATLQIVDDDSAGAVVTPTNLTITEPNGTGVFTLSLTSQPTATVTINLSSSDTGECTVPASASLTTVTWQQGVTVTVSAVDDALKDGSQPCTIQTSAASSDPLYDGIAVSDVSVTVTDDDSAGVEVTPTSLTVAEPSGSDTFNLRLTSQPTATVTINLTSSDTGECSVPASASLTTVTWQTGVTVTVTAVDDDLADGSQPCEISTTAASSDPNYDSIAVADVSVTVTDDDSAGVEVTPTSLTIAEPAGSDTFNLRLTNQPTATVTISLTSSDTSECSVPASASLTAVNWQTGVTVTVSAVDDALADGSQLCTVQTSAASSDPLYNGIAVSDVTVTVTDDDSAGVVVTPTNLTITEPNGTDVFTLSLTSQPTATVTINLSSSDTGECTVPASASLTAVTWQTGVSVTVSAVDDDLIDGDQLCIISGVFSSSDGNYNAQTFTNLVVTVKDDDNSARSIYLPLILKNFTLGPD